MILLQNPETGWWTEFEDGETHLVNTHNPGACVGALCDIHDRRGEEPWASWPLNWRDDRGYMEIIDPRTGIGHPSPAQSQHDRRTGDAAASIHGCDGGCAGAHDQLDRTETP